MAKITFSTEVSELMAFDEAAELLGMTRPNIYNLLKTGRLHRISIGDSAYVLRVEVERLKAVGKREAEATIEIDGNTYVLRAEVGSKNKEAEATTTPASS